MDKETFTREFNERRNKLSMDDLELSRALGISVTTINRYAKGGTFPNNLFITILFERMDHYLTQQESTE